MLKVSETALKRRFTDSMKRRKWNCIIWLTDVVKNKLFNQKLYQITSNKSICGKFYKNLDCNLFFELSLISFLKKTAIPAHPDKRRYGGQITRIFLLKV